MDRNITNKISFRKKKKLRGLGLVFTVYSSEYFLGYNFSFGCTFPIGTSIKVVEIKGTI